jgi:thiamine-monophosphate kinase
MYAGMQVLASKFGVSLVGGDTVRADKIIVNIALLGWVEKKYLTLRSGARAGDAICVTGPLGGSLASGRHATFTPRVQEARFLVEHVKPTAMMDLSDGLSSDLGHILESSRVGALIDESCLPLHPGVTTDQALNDGEDFELLFTVPQARLKSLKKNRTARTLCRVIGEVLPFGQGFKMIQKDGRFVTVKRKGYCHF